MSTVRAVPRERRSQAGRTFLREYFAQFQRLNAGSEEIFAALISVKETLMAASRAGRKIVVVGNGGSASIASHVAVDLTKNAKVKAINFNEADLITCFANDYGYERWLEQAVEAYGDVGDVLIAVSSSGRSPNILRACQAARQKGFSSIITFSGFGKENPLRALGDINCWVESKAYNLIEVTHSFWLLAVVDLIIGKAEYPASPAAGA